jgi:uncharacterized protein YjbI with pentapeptide repeats
MRSMEIDATNFETVEWDDGYFKHCEFSSFSKEGGVISSDFVGCSFKDLDWYWGMFTHANFIQCHFTNCTFRGTSFVDARFVECGLKDIHFVEDNLRSECDFSGAVAYGCTVEGGEGFKAQART